MLAALMALLYYAAVALRAVKALLSAGALGLLPLPVAALFGFLGALAWEAMRRVLREGPQPRVREASEGSPGSLPHGERRILRGSSPA